MPDYRRAFVPGGTFFFTVVTENRAPLFAVDGNRALLHDAIAQCKRRHRFELDAIVLLHDHFHFMATLPDGDSNFSLRLASIKSHFTRGYLAAGRGERARSPSRVEHRNRGVWQRRFYEHVIRDSDDLNRHLDYIHYNPVKHGLAACPHGWPHSSFHRAAERGQYQRDWNCGCDGRVARPMDFSWASGDME